MPPSPPPSVPSGESFWKRFWRFCFGSSVESADPEEQARLSFLLQQQEGELHALRQVLLEVQQSLKRAEADRQRFSDIFNLQSPGSEKQKNAGSGLGPKVFEDDARRFREQSEQQRVYGDRVQSLLNRLNDLQKQYSAAFTRLTHVHSSAEEKGWVLEKRALEEQVRETEDKVFLSEERADREKAEKLELKKQLDSLQKTIGDMQEKIRQAENSLQQEKKKSLDLEKERAVLQSKLKEAEGNYQHLKRESQFLEPAELSEELIVLRDRIQELEKSPETAAAEAGDSRRAAQERAASVVREYESLRDALERERSQWAEERARLESQKTEKTAEHEEELSARQKAEDRAQSLAQEAESLRQSIEEDRNRWAEERGRLLGQWEREKDHRVKELALRCNAEDHLSEALRKVENLQVVLQQERTKWTAQKADLEEALAMSKKTSAEGKDGEASWLSTHEDTDRLLKEIDGLLAENASLQDELRLARRGKG